MARLTINWNKDAIRTEDVYLQVPALIENEPIVSLEKEYYSVMVHLTLDTFPKQAKIEGTFTFNNHGDVLDDILDSLHKGRTIKILLACIDGSAPMKSGGIIASNFHLRPALQT